jgi:hypothetical protein
MKIIITEEQKGKLFIPRKIDDRKEQFNNDIKKFLNSIKDSIVWDYLGSIETQYNYEADYGEPSFYDFNGKYLNLSEVKNVFTDEYGKEEGDIKYIDFKGKLDKITEYMEGLLDVHGEGEVIYVWNEIKKLGNGHFKFMQHRDVRITETINEVKI